MHIVVGLGNPGSKYNNTPHNVGFEVIDLVAEQLGCKLRKSLRFNAESCKADCAEEKILLVKPLAYMNNSGFSVFEVLRKTGAKPQDLLVISDDADLVIGKIRIRASGGSGGHRGLQSITDRIGTNKYSRLRIGIGRGGESDLVRRVLSPFNSEEKRKMQDVIKLAADAVFCIIEKGVNTAMNEYNGLNILTDCKEKN